MKRKRILEALAERLRVIQMANGYATDAGRYLYWGPVVLGPNDPPVGIAIVPGPTETNALQQGKKIITLPVEFHALAFAPQEVDDAWLRVEAVLADIKRAIELEDTTMGRLAVDLTAGEVTPLVKSESGVFIGYAAEYRVVYTEHWGDPEQ